MLEIFKTLARSVFGMNHVANHENQYLEIVGNGLDAEHPRNARTLDIAGNEVLAGRLTVGAQPAGDNDVATKKYVDDNAGDELPAVTAVDNGDVLTVVEGAWAKAAPSGGVYNVTAVYDDSGEEAVFVFNKTWQEIYDAMSNGKAVFISYVNPDVEMASSGIALSEGAFVSTGTQWQNGYFVRYGGGNTAKADTANGYPVCDYM